MQTTSWIDSEIIQKQKEKISYYTYKELSFLAIWITDPNYGHSNATIQRHYLRWLDLIKQMICWETLR